MDTRQNSNTKQVITDAINYVNKNFKKPANYDQLHNVYDKWAEKAQKEMMKGKYKDKTLYHWGNLETVIALAEYLNAPTTEHINSALLDEAFVAQFESYQRNKVFDRNKQPRPEEEIDDEEIVSKMSDVNRML